jgi:hypothetical protein
MWKLHGATSQLMLTSVLGSSILKGTQQDQQQQQLRTVKDFPSWDALIADSGNHVNFFACFVKISCVFISIIRLLLLRFSFMIQHQMNDPQRLFLQDFFRRLKD